MKIEYKGILRTGSYGEYANALYIGDNDDPLTDMIESDILEYGNYLSVRYFISDTPQTLDELNENLFKQIIGVGSAELSLVYTETTGYLWTDENLIAGGHDLLQELKSSEGKYCYLEIEYNKEPVINHD